MWPWGSYFLSLYLSSFQPFMCLMHSDCDLLGSGTVFPTHTWQFCKESSALGHLDLMSVTQKWAVLRKKCIKLFPMYKFTAMMWNKPTELSDFLSFMSQIDVIILQHLQFQETHFLFSSQWHRNLSGYYSHELCQTLVWAGKCLMTARAVLFTWLREKHRNVWPDHSKQLCPGYWGRSKNGR